MNGRRLPVVFLFFLCSISPAAVPPGKTGENATLAAAFRNTEDKPRFLAGLLEKQPSPEAYGEKLCALFWEQKTLEDKARFLDGFRMSRTYSASSPYYPGRPYLRFMLAGALAKNPDSADLHFSLALLLRPHESVMGLDRLGHLKKAFELAPGNPLIALELGGEMLENGDAAEAETLLARHAGKAPNPMGRNDLAALCLISGRREKALALFRSGNSAEKTQEEILSDILLLIRFREIPAARELLERDGRRLSPERGQYLSALLHLLEGRNDKALPLLASLAAPGRVREVLRSAPCLFFGVNGRILERPELLYLEVSRKAPPEDLSIQRILFAENGSLQLLMPQRNPDAEIAGKSFLLLYALSRENPHLCADVRKELEKAGCRYAALYLGRSAEDWRRDAGKAAEALFRKHPDDPVCAETFFTEGRRAQRRFSRDELSGILKTLLKYRFPSAESVFYTIYARNDFSATEKRGLFRELAGSLLSASPDQIAGSRFAVPPEYQDILTEKWTALLRNPDADALSPEQYLAALFRYASLLRDRNRFPELISLLEDCGRNCRLLARRDGTYSHFSSGFPFFPGSSGPAQTACFFGISDADSLSLVSHLSRKLDSRDFRRMDVLDGVPRPLAAILMGLLKEKRNPAPPSEFSFLWNGRPPEIDWNAFLAAIRFSGLPLLLKAAAANMLDCPEEGRALLKEAAAGNPRPSPGFLLNAAALSIQFGGREQAAGFAEQLCALPEADHTARRIGAMVLLKCRAGEKTNPRTGELIEMLSRTTPTPEERNALFSFLRRNGYGSEAARLSPKRDSDNIRIPVVRHAASEAQRILDLARTDPEGACKALRPHLRNGLLEKRWRFYFPAATGFSSPRFLWDLAVSARIPGRMALLEKCCRTFSESGDPDDLRYAAEMADLLPKPRTKAAALYEKILKRTPDDTWSRWRLFLLQAGTSADAAQENYRILHRTTGINFMLRMQNLNDPAAVMSYVELVMRDNRNRGMSPLVFGNLLSLLRKSYDTGDGTVLKPLVRRRYRFIPSGTEDAFLAARRRALYLALCRYGEQVPELRRAVLDAELELAGPEKFFAGKDLLQEIRSAYPPGAPSAVSDTLRGAVCEYLLRTRKFAEMEGLIAELRKSAPGAAEAFESCLAFTRALLTVPAAQFEQVFSEALAARRISGEILLRSALLAGEARNLSFPVAPYLLKDGMRGDSLSAIKLLHTCLDFAAERRDPEKIRDFLLHFYTLCAEASANAPRTWEEQTQRKYLDYLLARIPLTINTPYSDNKTVLEGFLLAILSPRRPPLPPRQEGDLQRTLEFSDLCRSPACPELDLFRILKQTDAFASGEKFSLPGCVSARFFMRLGRKTKQKLIRDIDACGEKTFGMKLVRALCGRWYDGSLMEVLAGELPELRNVRQEKRSALWMTLRTVYSGFPAFRSGAVRKGCPELEKLIADDIGKACEAQYVRAMALSEIPSTEDLTACGELRQLYRRLAKEDPPRAEKLADHLIGLALDSSNPMLQVQMIFGFQPDFLIWRKIREAGILKSAKDLTPVTLERLFRAEYLRTPPAGRVRRFPELYREFAQIFPDAFGEQAAIHLIARLHFRTPADLAFLNQAFASVKSASPAAAAARKLFRMMDEAACGKLSEESRREAERLGERLLNNSASSAERRWLSMYPELFADSPRKLEFLQGIAASLSRETGNNPAGNPDACVHLLEILVRQKESIGKEKFTAAFSGFFANCFEKFPAQNRLLRKRLLPPLADFYTWVGDAEKVRRLRESSARTVPARRRAPIPAGARPVERKLTF